MLQYLLGSRVSRCWWCSAPRKAQPNNTPVRVLALALLIMAVVLAAAGLLLTNLHTNALHATLDNNGTHDDNAALDNDAMFGSDNLNANHTLGNGTLNDNKTATIELNANGTAVSTVNANHTLRNGTLNDNKTTTAELNANMTTASSVDKPASINLDPLTSGMHCPNIAADDSTYYLSWATAFTSLLVVLYTSRCTLTMINSVIKQHDDLTDGANRALSQASDIQTAVSEKLVPQLPQFVREGGSLCICFRMHPFA